MNGRKITNSYLEHKDELMAKIRQILGKNDGSHIDKLATELGANFNGGALYEIIGNPIMSEKQKTILVTGGSGYIGSVTCKLSS